MAYEYTTREIASVGDLRLIEVVETDILTTSEFVLDLPELCWLVSYQASLLTAGSASTIDPEAGAESGWTSAGFASLFENATAAVHVRNDSPDDLRALRLPAGKMYVRSNPDVATGATGRIVTHITLRYGGA